MIKKAFAVINQTFKYYKYNQTNNRKFRSGSLANFEENKRKDNQLRIYGKMIKLSKIVQSAVQKTQSQNHKNEAKNEIK